MEPQEILDRAIRQGADYTLKKVAQRPALHHVPKRELLDVLHDLEEVTKAIRMELNDRVR